MAESEPDRGHLTIFLGAAPGVGKTYAMLEAARRDREEDRDVAVGLVETHGRYDTGAMLLGLEILPRRKIEHRGAEVEELDLDAVLARRPGLVLVDELAHANAPGSRHAKRWQDVDEVLAAGIDVYTTMNVQHLESLNDVVAQITHVVVKETVPDSVLDTADDVRLIDLPIDELLDRLRDGKVFVPEKARAAAQAFFQEGNLIALRELALRVTAQQVDAEMRRYRAAHGIERTWPAAERVLVCVSASPASEHLVRGGRRLARSTHSEWIAAWVEGPDALRMSQRSRERLDANLALARSLGAETVSLSSDLAADEIIRFARTRNVTRIVVGKPTHSTIRDRLRPSFLDRLVRISGDIDIHVMTGVGDLERLPPPGASRSTPRAATGYAAAAALVALSTATGSALFGPDQTADVLMMYLLAIVLVSMRWGIASSVFASVIAIMGFDYFFVPPYHTFAITDFRHVGTFGIMLLVAVVISGLTRRVREQADAARRRELRTASLYALSRALSSAKSTGEVAAAATKSTAEVFGVEATLSIPVAGDALAQSTVDAWGFALDEKDARAAEWAYRHGGVAGKGTATLPDVAAMHVALVGTTARVGVLSIRPRAAAIALDHDTKNHLDAFASQIAAAVERARLAELAQRAELRAQTEQVKSSLLSSVSHDLRTPLAVITGTASALLEGNIAETDRRDLTRAILEESERLGRLVTNLLDVTRLEAGAVEPNKEWQHVEEVVGAALARTDRWLAGRAISIDVPASLPLVSFDSVLVEQVLVNLLENAAKYTPEGAAIEIAAHEAGDDAVEISVADHGPGLAAGEERRIFEKFYRAHKGRGGGAGLGLAICDAILSAHGGRIWAENRDGGGAVFRLTLPRGEGAPLLHELPDSVPSTEDRASP